MYRPKGFGFLGLFGRKTAIHFAYFCLESGIVTFNIEQARENWSTSLERAPLKLINLPIC